jgi:hypothetical protein
MMSGSVIFKIQSNNTNSYISQMKPYIHYIPIHSNLSNLHTITKLITANNTKTIKLLNKIVINSRKLAQQYTYEKQLITAVFSINNITHRMKYNIQINDNNSNSSIDYKMYYMPVPIKRYSNGSLYEMSKILFQCINSSS